jgi:hypothetical protein
MALGLQAVDFGRQHESVWVRVVGQGESGWVRLSWPGLAGDKSEMRCNVVSISRRAARLETCVETREKDQRSVGGRLRVL